MSEVSLYPLRSLVNLAQIRHSRPDSGLVVYTGHFSGKRVQSIQVVLFLLDSDPIQRPSKGFRESCVGLNGRQYHWDMEGPYLIHSVFEVVLHDSTPLQIRIFIYYY